VGFVVEKVSLEQAFCEYFGFPCHFSFHHLSRLIITILRSWYNGPSSEKRTKWTVSPHPTNKINMLLSRSLQMPEQPGVRAAMVHYKDERKESDGGNKIDIKSNNKSSETATFTLSHRN
jgi:hypothetical protein